MTDRIERIADAHGVTVATMAHAGDGNLHPIFVVPNGEIPAEVWTAAAEVFGAALDLGGTLTGEHGVGLLKQQWLGQELGSDAAGLMHGIKTVFDPHGILNPGKALPTR